MAAKKGKTGKKAAAQAAEAAPDVEEAEPPKKKGKSTPEAKVPSKPEVEEPEDDKEGSDDEGDASEDEDGDGSEEADPAEGAWEGAIVPSKGAPKAATKKRKTKAHRLEEAQARADADAEGGGVLDENIPKGVIYIGHIPDGFGEPQMRKYFNQFGTVLRLRLSRSRLNAKSKGYAFVEFEEDDVAKIVAQTMDGYLIFGKKLVCHMVEKEKLHPKLFLGWNKKMLNFSVRRMKDARTAYNDRPATEVDGERISVTTSRQVKKRATRNAKLEGLLKTLEVDYDLSEFQVPDRKSLKRSARLKAADSPKIKAASSPKVKAVTSPKLQVASSPKVAPKVSVEEIMEEAAAAAAASAPAQEAAPAAAGAGKGKKRKKAAA